MHQLGIAKQTIESFELFVKGQETDRRGNRKHALQTIANIAQNYGALLSRQSDRNFPRTKFTTSFLTNTKKDGKDYAGIILCLIVAMMSGKENWYCRKKPL